MKNIKNIDIILIAILSLSSILLLYIAFFKKDAIDLEIIKSWWKENFTLVKEIYQNPSYISQQRDAIKEWLNSLWVQ